MSDFSKYDLQSTDCIDLTLELQGCEVVCRAWYHYSPFRPAVTGYKPEFCFPEEPEELEIECIAHLLADGEMADLTNLLYIQDVESNIYEELHEAIESKIEIENYNKGGE